MKWIMRWLVAGGWVDGVISGHVHVYKVGRRLFRWKLYRGGGVVGVWVVVAECDARIVQVTEGS
jgi:hypothetical protein